MRIFYLLTLICCSLLSCDKEKKFNDKIEGEWHPVSLKISDYSGIGYYAETQGSIKFQKDSKKSTTGSYVIEMNYLLNGTEKTILEEGTYSVKEDNIIRKPLNGEENKAIITYVNKEDFELEIPNLDNERYQFVLKRKD